MKRLWVRLSIAFGAVILVFMLALGGSGWLLRAAGVGPSARAIRAELASGDITPEQAAQHVPAALIWFAAVVGVVGTIAGVWFSRTLTAPLEDLAEAARAVGARDLSRRVAVRGSQELIEVGAAFNQMAAELEQAETLRRNLIADISHELRTPLTVIQGNLRAILDDVYTLDKEEVSRLYDQTRHLSRLVEELHELSLAEARQLPLLRRPVDLVALIGGVVEVVRPVAADSGVSLAARLPDSLPSVDADPARLTQVLHNLISNALRHTPPGGTITLEAASEDQAVRISVADTGEGIAPEHLPYIFDRFYRTDASRARQSGGTGLGLAIVRAIIESHDGRVLAASAGPGQGAVITLFLPVGAPGDPSP